MWHDEHACRRRWATRSKLAALTMLIAVPLGIAMAIGLHRWRGRVLAGANGLMLLPLVTPEIVMGVALFLVFTRSTRASPRGFTTQLLGHITFTRLVRRGDRPRPARVDRPPVRGGGARPRRHAGAGDATGAAARCSARRSSPALMVFATSIDDFVISSFLSTGAGSETVPMKIYSSARGAATPALNALATIMLVITMVALALAFVMLRVLRRRSGGAPVGAARDLATLEI